uniref:hypothetical protein n=1 Tax=Actinotalea sp. TaxID=1872145 RepID=UPI0035659923
MTGPEPSALVLTQVGDASLLAAACALGGVAIDALDTPVGAVAVCRSLAPGEPERAAEAISRLLANTPVVLVVQRDGQIAASRWSAGQRGDVVAPGLLLDGAPPQVEGLLLGTLTRADLDGTVTSVGISRWR